MVNLVVVGVIDVVVAKVLPEGSSTAQAKVYGRFVDAFVTLRTKLIPGELLSWILIADCVSE